MINNKQLKNILFIGRLSPYDYVLTTLTRSALPTPFGKYIFRHLATQGNSSSEGRPSREGGAKPVFFPEKGKKQRELDLVKSTESKLKNQNYLISNIDLDAYVKKVREERLISALKKLAEKGFKSAMPTNPKGGITERGLNKTDSPLRGGRPKGARKNKNLITKKGLINKKTFVQPGQRLRVTPNNSIASRSKGRLNLLNSSLWDLTKEVTAKPNVNKWANKESKLKHILIAKKVNLAKQAKHNLNKNNLVGLTLPKKGTALYERLVKQTIPSGAKTYYLNTLNLFNYIQNNNLPFVPFFGESTFLKDSNIFGSPKDTALPTIVQPLKGDDIGSKKALCEFIFKKPYPFVDESLQTLSPHLVSFKTYKNQFPTLKARKELLKKLSMRVQIDTLFSSRAKEFLNQYIKDIKNFFSVPFLKTDLTNTLTPLKYKWNPSHSPFVRGESITETAQQCLLENNPQQSPLNTNPQHSRGIVPYPPKIFVPYPPGLMVSNLPSGKVKTPEQLAKDRFASILKEIQLVSFSPKGADNEGVSIQSKSPFNKVGLHKKTAWQSQLPSLSALSPKEIKGRGLVGNGGIFSDKNYLVSNNIGDSLNDDRFASLYFFNQFNKFSTKAKFANLYQGLQMKVSGRLKGVQRARKLQYNYGRISAQTVRSFLLSNKAPIFTKWGIYGSTVFISRSS